MADDNKEDHSKRPEDSNFKQQRLKAWQPLLTPNWVIGTFALIGVIFIPIGIIVLLASQSVIEVETRYDTLCTTLGNECTVQLSIEKDMPSPVFFYYKLTNFYQNHRRYVKSRSDPQLSGSTVSDVAGCDPLPNSGGVSLYPCGLIANSVFNDKLFNVTLLKPDGVTMVTLNSAEDVSTWQKTGIAWKSDKEKKFVEKFPNVEDLSLQGFTRYSPILKDYTNGTTQPVAQLMPYLSDEDLMVWMRTAGLPTFKKLYRVINMDLKAGSVLTVRLIHNFPVTPFDGQKAFVISTTSWLGGKNDFLGVAYLVVGALCLFLSLVFLIKHLVSPRNMGDMSYLNWSGGRPTPAS
jgi:hypothetical protein